MSIAKYTNIQIVEHLPADDLDILSYKPDYAAEYELKHAFKKMKIFETYTKILQKEDISLKKRRRKKKKKKRDKKKYGKRRKKKEEKKEEEEKK